MDNSMATRPYSKLKGDPYRAFEELPAEVRRAMQEALVDWCPLRARELHLDLIRRQRLRPAQAAHVLVQTIRRLDHAEVAAFARTWPKGAEAYPHLAAGATLQRYTGTEGIPAAEPILIPPAPKQAGAERPGARQEGAKQGRTKRATAKQVGAKRVAARPPKAKPAKAKRSKGRTARQAGRRARR